MREPQDDAGGPFRSEVSEALRMVQAGNPQEAAARLRPLADGGDLAAAVALLQLLWTPTWTDGIPYAFRIAQEGIATPFLANYVNNMLNEASHRDDGVAIARLVAGSGIQVDFAGLAQNLAQQGDVDHAAELFEIATLPTRSGDERDWVRLLSTAHTSLGDIRQQQQQAAAAKDAALSAIREHVDAIGTERGRAEELVQKVGALVHEATSHQLAKEYAKQAKKEEATANRYTLAALTVAGATAVLGLIVAAAVLLADHDLENALRKASLAIPLLAFAAYVGKLAGNHRRMAWHWRHVELQLLTADGFIAPLEESPRKALLAALALRLFPGQPQDPQRGGAEAPDPSAFLTELAKPPQSPSRPG